MNEKPRPPKPKKDQLTKPYKKTPFDREEKPRITFDLNNAMTERERRELESRENLFRHRWKEEQEFKARQKRRSKEWQREHNKHQETWRDVYCGDRNRNTKPTPTL